MEKNHFKYTDADNFLIDLFCPYQPAFAPVHKDNLKKWLEDKKDSFIFYNYAMATLSISEEQEKDKSKKMNRKHRNNIYLEKGKNDRQMDCVCLYIYYLFKNVRKSNVKNDKNEAKFKEAYDLLSECLITNGLINAMDPKDSTLAFLKFYYILLDVYPGFRQYCFARLMNAVEFISVNNISDNKDDISLFKKELILIKHDTKNEQIIRDIAMLVVTEYDITSELFYQSVNLLAYLCNSSKKFYYLGLFLGDIYDKKILGAFQQLDDELRTSFYEQAEKCTEPQHINIVRQAKARINVLYQITFDSYIAPNKSEDIKDREIEAFYNRLIKLNEELIMFNHPSALTFFVSHFIRSNDHKIKGRLIPEEDIFPVQSIILNREVDLTRASKYLNDLAVIGDPSQLHVHYRLLRLLRFEEVFLSALRIAGEYSEEKLLSPLAYCKEKGIGGPPDLQFSLSVYVNSITHLIDQREKDYNAISQLLYRIGLIVKRGGDLKRGITILKCSLYFAYESDYNNKLDKRFVYHLSMIINQLDIPNQEQIVKDLIFRAYKIYPANTIEFLLHYEIEKRVEVNINRLKSRIKSDLNEIGNVIRITSDFGEEMAFRKLNAGIVSDCKRKLDELKIELKKDIFVNQIEELFHSIKKNGGSANILKDIDSSGLNVTTIYSILPQSEQSQNIQLMFEAIKKKRDKKKEELSMEKSKEKQIEYLINRLTLSNPYARQIKDEDVLIMFKTDKESIKVPNLHNIAFKKVQLIRNHQLSRRIILEFNDINGTQVLIKNFQYFNTFNPLFVNYLGINYEKYSEKYSIQIFTEYFEKFCSEFECGYISSNNVAADIIRKATYQLVNGVRSLHTIGKVCFFISNKFISITPDYNVKLLLPFWERYFSDPMEYLDNCWNKIDGKNKDGYVLEDLFHFPPEVFQDNSPYESNHQKISMTFNLFYSDVDNELFSYFSAFDIWSLGIVLYQMFSGCRFYSNNQFTSLDEFRKFCRNPKQVESHVKSRMEMIPKNISGEVKQIIHKMLKWDPRNRPNIGEIVSVVESLVFNSIYNISAINTSELIKMMYQNVYYEIEKEIKVEKEIEKETIYLPKNYLFEGECIRCIPNGKGSVYLGEAKVLTGEFIDGGLHKKAEIMFGHRDFFEFNINEQNTPKNARVIYSRGNKNETEAQVESFEENTWLPSILQLFHNFSHFMKDIEQKTNKKENKFERSLKEDLFGDLKTKIIKGKNEIVSTTISQRYSLQSKDIKNIKDEIIEYLTFIKVNDNMFDNVEKGSSNFDFYISKLQNEYNNKWHIMEDNKKTDKTEDKNLDKNEESRSKEFIDNFIKIYNEIENEMKSQVQSIRYPSIFFDPFGNSIRVLYDKEKYQCLYRNGVVISPIETYKAYNIYAYRPSVSLRQVFYSRINSFSICDAGIPVLSFSDLYSCLQSSNYMYAIITEIEGKQFRGEVNEHGPVMGRLYLNNNMHIDLEKNVTEENYTSLVMDAKNEIEYEGRLEDGKKNGFGSLRYNNSIRFRGYFKDGLPHGKGILLGSKGELVFRGLFCNGSRKFGTANGPSRKEIYGVFYNEVDYSNKSTIPVSNKSIDFDSFVNDNIKNQEKLWMADGTIRVRRKYPIYYGRFKGWNNLFDGIVKIDVRQNVIFYGCYQDGQRVYKGHLMEENGNELVGYWYGNSVKGKYYCSNTRHSTVEYRTGYFIVDDEFKNIVQKGKGEIFYLDSSRYRGEIDNNKPNGYGVKILKNDNKYEGMFVQDLYEGYGIRTDILDRRNTSIYEGIFKQNKLEGIAFYQSIRDDKSIKIIGNWVENEMKSMILNKPDMYINDFLVNKIVGQVEYNEFEYSYTMRGICRAEFRKLYTSDKERSELVDKLMMLIMESVLLTGQKSLSIFQVAFHIIEVIVEDISKHNHSMDSYEYYKVVRRGIERMIDVYHTESTNENKKDILRGLLMRFSPKKDNQKKREEEMLDQLLNDVLDLVHISAVDGGKDTNKRDGLKEVLGRAMISSYYDDRSMDGDIRKQMGNEYKNSILKIMKTYPDEFSKLTKNAAKIIGHSSRDISVYENNTSRNIDKEKEGKSIVMMERIERERAKKNKKTVLDQSSMVNSSIFPRFHYAVDLNKLPIISNLERTKSIIQDSPRRIPGLVSNNDEVMGKIFIKRLETYGIDDYEDEMCTELTNMVHMVREVRRYIDIWIEEYNTLIPDTYEGEIFNSELTGNGIIQRSEIDENGYTSTIILYEGEMKDNYSSGLGRLKIDNQQEYFGIVERCEPNGYGKLIVGEKSKLNYYGLFVNGKKEKVFVKTLSSFKVKGGQDDDTRVREKLLGFYKYDNGLKNDICMVRNRDKTESYIEYTNDNILKARKFKAGGLFDQKLDAEKKGDNN